MKNYKKTILAACLALGAVTLVAEKSVASASSDEADYHRAVDLDKIDKLERALGVVSSDESNLGIYLGYEYNVGVFSEKEINEVKIGDLAILNKLLKSMSSLLSDKIMILEEILKLCDKNSLRGTSKKMDASIAALELRKEESVKKALSVYKATVRSFERLQESRIQK